MHSSALQIILPPNAAEPPTTNLFNIGIQFNYFFAIPCSKHRTKNAKDVTIVVGDTFESKRRIAFLPLCPVVISGRAVVPLYV
jgi:hypothetical protein